MRRPLRAWQYAKQLQEKQKARRVAGISERQFANYFLKARKKPGLTGENLLRLLECRLDNIVYRLGLASSHQQARQLVRHGHILVNGRRVNVPSYQLSVGDTVALKGGNQGPAFVRQLVERSQPTVPDFLEFDPKMLTGKLKTLPTREQLSIKVEDQLIVEFYSK
jgi:small subunit ribosomal protein S4